MNIELLSVTNNPDKLIEEAGRTCYLSTDKITESSSDNFIQRAIKRGHESIVEHASATFRISGVSRALTHQLVRHRLASYSQQSQRYVNEEDFDYVIPCSITENKNPEVIDVFTLAMAYSHLAYKRLRELGVPREDARFILPTATATEIVVTMNFRELRSFLKLRMSESAQWEIRKLAHSILDVMIQIAPNVFQDLEVKNEK